MTARNASKAARPDTPGGPPALIELTSGADEAPEYADLFSIDGTTYQILTKPKVNTAMRYMHIGRTQGTEAAVDFMLGVLLGDEAHEALMAYDDLTTEQLTDIITAASKIMQGAAEVPKGQRPNG